MQDLLPFLLSDLPQRCFSVKNTKVDSSEVGRIWVSSIKCLNKVQKLEKKSLIPHKKVVYLPLTHVVITVGTRPTVSQYD